MEKIEIENWKDTYDHTFEVHSPEWIKVWFLNHRKYLIKATERRMKRMCKIAVKNTIKKYCSDPRLMKYWDPDKTDEKYFPETLLDEIKKEIKNL